MGRLKIFQALGFSIVSVLPQTTFADIGVPSAARMVHEADVIVVGKVQPGNPPKLVVQKVLKGNVAPNQPLILADPSKGQFLSFNISGVTQIVGHNPTVVLGKLDADNTTLTLSWLNYSIWPYGYKHDTFSSDDLQTTLDFLKRLLDYSLFARREPDRVVRQLVDDITTESAESTLAYLEVAVEADFDSTTAEQIRAVCAAQMQTTKLDVPALRQFADTAHLFPVTLAAPLAMTLAQFSASEELERLKNVLYAMLSARGATIVQNSSMEDIRNSFQQIVPSLRRIEGRRLVNIFESPLTSLREIYGDSLLEVVVERRPPQDLKTLSAPDRKEAWLREIDTMSD